MGDKTAQQGLGGANNNEQSDGNQQTTAANVKAFPHVLLAPYQAPVKALTYEGCVAQEQAPDLSSSGAFETLAKGCQLHVSRSP